jgi:CYTH domain-containing protein
MAEVEFESEEQANAFEAPGWFGEEVTFDGRYHNSYMSRMKFDE